MPISHSMSFIPIFLIEYHVCDSQFVRHWRLKDEQVRDSFCAFGSCSLIILMEETKVKNKTQIVVGFYGQTYI